MILQENFKLSNDVLIPKLGLGTWFIKDENAAQAVRDAVAIGYRHIDTAQAYGNEAGVGEGVAVVVLNVVNCLSPQNWMRVSSPMKRL